MKNWYQTRENASLQHKSAEAPHGNRVERFASEAVGGLQSALDFKSSFRGGQPITNGKRIFLTEAQAHANRVPTLRSNGGGGQATHGDAIEKSEAPTNADESAVRSEYEEWRATQSVKPTDKPAGYVKSNK